MSSSLASILGKKGENDFVIDSSVQDEARLAWSVCVCIKAIKPPGGAIHNLPEDMMRPHELHWHSLSLNGRIVRCCHDTSRLTSGASWLSGNPQSPTHLTPGILNGALGSAAHSGSFQLHFTPNGFQKKNTLIHSHGCCSCLDLLSKRISR